MIVNEAIAYRRRGFSIIPIKGRDKKPLIAWEHHQKEPASEETIKHWFESWPNANVGIVTGTVSDVVVIDIDSDEAREKLKARLGELSSVPRAKTGRGWQLFFKHPGVNIPNRTAVVPGLDIRGDGGYVVAPPSIHPNGKQYEWEVSLNGELPSLSAEAVKLISTPTDEAGHREKFNTAEALKGVPKGQQRVTVFKLACKLRRSDVPLEVAERLILEAAGNCEPPLPENEAVSQCRDAYKRYQPAREQQSEAKQPELWPEFRSAEQILMEPEEPIQWLWTDCLPTAGSSVLVSQPKIGKTTFAVNLALAAARGIPFLSRTTQKCPVAYAYLDGPPREIKNTFKKVGIRATDPIFIHAGAAPRDYVAWIMHQVEQLGIKFIIIDTFQKFFRIDNINDYSEVVNKSAPMLDAAAAKDVHLLFLHHAGKGDKGDLDSAIGSTAIRGQVQSYLHIKLLPNSTRRIFRSDQRHGEGNFPEVAIGFDRLGWLEIKGTREDAEIQDAKPTVRELLENADDELTEKQIRAGIPLRGIIVSKALREMYKSSDVERSGEGKRGRAFKYSLAAELATKGSCSSLKEGSANPEDSLFKGGILKGGKDSCPNSYSLGNGVSGTRIQNSEKTIVNKDGIQVPEKRDTNGTRKDTNPGSGHESKPGKPEPGKDGWELVK